MKRPLFSVLAVLCLGLTALPGTGQVLVQATGVQRSRTGLGARLSAPQATITPANGLPAGQAGGTIPVILAASGFGAAEPVSFLFGKADPASGTISSPLLSASGLTDNQGQISNLLGSIPVPIQNLIPPIDGGGLYTLQVRGQASGLVANVTINYPFSPLVNSLSCPTNNVSPGQPFSVAGTNLAAGTTVVGAIGFAARQQGNATVDAAGNFSLTFTMPQNGGGQTYPLVVAGLIHMSSGYQEELRTCTIGAGTGAPQIQSSPPTALIGGTTTVTGRGFLANEPIQISLQYVTGASTGTDVPGTAKISSAADNSGNFSIVYSVGSTADALVAGTYNLTATGQQSHMVAHVPFYVSQVVTLQPSSGPPGATVGISAIPGSFSPNDAVTVFFNDPNPNNVQQQQIATGTANADGSFSQSVTIPVPASGGKATVTLYAAAKTLTTSFVVTQSLTVNPSSGPPGSSALVTGHGFTSGKSVIMSFVTSASTLTLSLPITATVLGELSTIVIIPGQAQNGSAMISAQDLQLSNTAQIPFTVVGAPTPPVNSPTNVVEAMPSSTPTLLPTAMPLPTHSRTQHIKPMPTVTPTHVPVRTPGSVFVPFASSTPVGAPFPVAVPVRLILSQSVLDQGQLETAIVHAPPFTQLSFTIAYAGLAAEAGGLLRTDSAGNGSWRFLATGGPAGRATWRLGLVKVRLTGLRTTGEATAYFMVYPPLRLTIQARVVVQQGRRMLLVGVQIARAGQVVASAQLPSQAAQRITVRGNGDARHPLLWRLPLGIAHGKSIVRLTVIVHTRDGITESRTLTLMTP